LAKSSYWDFVCCNNTTAGLVEKMRRDNSEVDFGVKEPKLMINSISMPSRRGSDIMESSRDKKSDNNYRKSTVFSPTSRVH
jgi:hypothetical protein